MSAFTRDEALAFVQALRLHIDGKPGFTWFSQRLVALIEYMEGNAAEVERFNAYLDWADCRDDYEAYAGVHPLSEFGSGRDEG